jgi:hypothetical protein
MNAISHVAVWATGIVQFLLGAGWYTLLGPAWMAGIGKTEAQLVAEEGVTDPLPLDSDALAGGMNPVEVHHRYGKF